MNKQLMLVAVISMMLIAPAHAADASSPAAGPALSPQAIANPKRVIASVADVQVTLDEMLPPLVDGYGLNILLNLLQLELVKKNVERVGLSVTPDDIKREREQTIENMFRDSNEKQLDRVNEYLSKNQTAEAEKLRAQIKVDNEQAFEQFLANQHISRAEFDIVTETNANLRKLAEPMMQGRINDDNLREAFNALYGENIKCKHIQCANLQEIQEAKRRLAAGEPFAKVAQEMSRNVGTAPLGGDLPPFSLQMQDFPQAFKDAAFALKEGQVSEVVQAEGAYHLILLEKRIPPKAVKFEDVKESLRTDLQKRALEATVKELRQQLSEQAVRGIMINDPTLKQQWDARLAKRQGELKERDDIIQQKERERNRAVTQPAPGESPVK